MLWNLTAAAGLPACRDISGFHRSVPLAALADGTFLSATEGLHGCSVLVRTAAQLPAVIAMLELDGVARRMVLVPPDASAAHLDTVITAAEIDTVVTDEPASFPGLRVLSVATSPTRRDEPRSHSRDTEWVLFTSGTTGAPKLVAHTLSALTGPIGRTVDGAVWSTFYDVRRYGGLQILLRALLGGGSMVLSDAAEPVGPFLSRAAAAGVTHISGTPSHWRRALMSGHATTIAPAYVRLSGEIADQRLLDRLGDAFPAARVSHAFASTEAGVAFDVTDGLAGFPASWIGGAGPADLRVVDGTLRIRSARTATGYIAAPVPLADPDGFIDTGDRVELRGDRYVFLGRAGGVINVGGQKVHPEEVEAALNAHPGVLAARVKSRRSPITGALVTAEIVVETSEDDDTRLRGAILDGCRGRLAPHKVPAILRIVAALDVLPSGKLDRRVA